MFINSVFIFFFFILGSDNNLQNEEYSLNAVKDIFSKINDTICIPMNYKTSNNICINDESGKYFKIIFTTHNVYNV